MNESRGGQIREALSHAEHCKTTSTTGSASYFQQGPFPLFVELFLFHGVCLLELGENLVHQLLHGSVKENLVHRLGPEVDVAVWAHAEALGEHLVQAVLAEGVQALRDGVSLPEVPLADATHKVLVQGVHA